MGNLIRVIRCPFHYDTHRSLAIYDNGDHKSFYCFGCKKYGKLDDNNIITDSSTIRIPDKKVIRIPRTDIKEYEPLYPTGVSWLELRDIGLDIACEYGIREHQNKLLLPCYNKVGMIHGYQVRDMSEKPEYKYITLPVNKKYPKYSMVTSKGQYIYLVESIIDGLSLQQKTGYSWIAMLGTTLSDVVITVLHELNKTIVILLDPDASILTGLIRDKLHYTHGLSVMAVYPGVAVYTLNQEQLSQITEDY